VRSVEQLLIDALAELGLPGAGRLAEYPGVWVDVDGPDPARSPRSACASRGRTMHGFALNVTTDLTYMREHIVPCGIADRPVTSLARRASTSDARGGRRRRPAGRGAVVRWAASSARTWCGSTARRPLAPFSRGEGPGEPVHLAASHQRLEQAGVTDGLSIESRKPDWLRPKVQLGPRC
jgi:lipoyl synthase